MKRQTYTIRLKHAREIFPDKWAKVRSHDVITRLVDKKKFMTKNEQKKMEDLSGKIRQGLFGINFSNQDLLATRKGRQVSFEALYDND